MEKPAWPSDWSVLVSTDLRNVIEATFSADRARDFALRLISLIWKEYEVDSFNLIRAFNAIQIFLRHFGSLDVGTTLTAETEKILNSETQFLLKMTQNEEKDVSLENGKRIAEKPFDVRFEDGDITYDSYYAPQLQLSVLNIFKSVVSATTYCELLTHLLVETRYHVARQAALEVTRRLENVIAKWLPLHRSHTKAEHKSFVEYLSLYQMPARITDSVRQVAVEYLRGLSYKFIEQCVDELPEFGPMAAPVVSRIKELDSAAVTIDQLDSLLRLVEATSASFAVYKPGCHDSGDFMFAFSDALLRCFSAFCESDAEIACARTLLGTENLLEMILRERFYRKVSLLVADVF